MLRLRRTEPALQRPEGLGVAALDDATLAILRRVDGDALLLVMCTRAPRRIDVRRWRAVPPDMTWQIVLSTGDPRFAESRNPGADADVAVDLRDGFSLAFALPASVILRGT